MYSYEHPSCLGSTFVGGTLRKSDQLHQTFEKSSIAMTLINWSGFCGMLHGLVINWSSSAIETSRNRVNVFLFITVFSLRLMMLGEVDRETLGLACGVLLIFTPRASALAGCDTYNEDSESEIVMVKMHKCMAWLDDEPIGDLDTMEDKVDNLSPQCTP
ncbi:hypothetical protein Tco_0311436 [Tanacetum coccineum]